MHERTRRERRYEVTVRRQARYNAPPHTHIRVPAHRRELTAVLRTAIDAMQRAEMVNNGPELELIVAQRRDPDDYVECLRATAAKRRSNGEPAVAFHLPNRTVITTETRAAAYATRRIDYEAAEADALSGGTEDRTETADRGYGSRGWTINGVDTNDLEASLAPALSQLDATGRHIHVAYDGEPLAEVWASATMEQRRRGTSAVRLAFTADGEDPKRQVTLSGDESTAQWLAHHLRFRVHEGPAPDMPRTIDAPEPATLEPPDNAPPPAPNQSRWSIDGQPTTELVAQLTKALGRIADHGGEFTIEHDGQPFARCRAVTDTVLAKRGKETFAIEFSGNDGPAGRPITDDPAHREVSARRVRVRLCDRLAKERAKAATERNRRQRREAVQQELERRGATAGRPAAGDDPAANDPAANDPAANDPTDGDSPTEWTVNGNPALDLAAAIGRTLSGMPARGWTATVARHGRTHATLAVEERVDLEREDRRVWLRFTDDDRHDDGRRCLGTLDPAARNDIARAAANALQTSVGDSETTSRGMTKTAPAASAIDALLTQAAKGPGGTMTLRIADGDDAGGYTLQLRRTATGMRLRLQPNADRDDPAFQAAAELLSERLDHRPDEVRYEWRVDPADRNAKG